MIYDISTVCPVLVVLCIPLSVVVIILSSTSYDSDPEPGLGSSMRYLSLPGPVVRS